MNISGQRGTFYVDGKPIGEIQSVEINIEREETPGLESIDLRGKTFTGTGRIEWKQPTFEEQLAASYNLTPEQAQQLVESIRRAADQMGLAFQEIYQGVSALLTQLRESPDYKQLAALMNETPPPRPDLPKHKYERPRLPSQQGYNRTPYDHWRGSLGQQRGKRKL